MSAGYIMSDAHMSPCGTYRYSLLRKWHPDGGWLVVVGLNPSTADALQDDPTIRRCVHFAKRESRTGLVMLNLFALRATDPRVMRAHPEPVGPDNDAVIRALAGTTNRTIVAAWGAHGSYRNRADEVAKMVPDLQCFGLTKGGHPRHPLYLRSDTPLVPFAPRAA